MKPLIALTGSTGTLGSTILSHLTEKRKNVRALSRKEGVYFDYEKEETHESALEGATHLILITLRESEGLKSFLEKAKHIKHTIVISGLSANARNDSFLANVETYVRQADLPHTILRLNWFMQNFLTYFYDDIMRRDLIEQPAGDAKISFVDTRDIAMAIAKLLEKKPEDKIYSITGPEALSFSQVAEILTAVTEREITYRTLSEEEGLEKYQGFGWDPEAIEEMMLLFRDIKSGLTGPVEPALTQLLGIPATSFKQFAEDHKAAWML